MSAKILFCAVLVVLALSTFVAGQAIDCNRPNEHYECGACQTKCSNLGQTCRIVNVRCNEDCYCNDGYARDTSDTCIPISQCP